MKRRNRKTSPPKNLPSGKSSARTCIWKRELSKKPPLFLTRRFAPRAKNTPQTRQVLFGLHCTTKLEPLSSRRATDFARSACVVASYFIRGGRFELEWGGKKAGRACLLHYTIVLVYNVNESAMMWI